MKWYKNRFLSENRTLSEIGPCPKIANYFAEVWLCHRDIFWRFDSNRSDKVSILWLATSVTTSRYFGQIKRMIELNNTYNRAMCWSVSVATYSLRCIHFRWFLQRQKKDWETKDLRIMIRFEQPYVHLQYSFNCVFG